MRKILVIASREYQAAVRTKTFLVSLLVMPLLMGGSALIPLALQDFPDTSDRHFVLVDRTRDKALLPALEESLKSYNEKTIFNAEGTQVKPRFDVKIEPPSSPTEDAISQQRFELAERVRKGKLLGFLEILDQNGASHTPYLLRYNTNRTLYRTFAQFVESAATKAVQEKLRTSAGLDEHDLQVLLDPVESRMHGLVRRDPRTGRLEEASKESLIASAVLPPTLMMLMFSVVFMAAGPLLQSVVEEKMQRIAEVLLASVTPFQLMLGKLIGMCGVSMTIESVYLLCLYLAAWQWGFAYFIPLGLIAWFVVFQALAALMYGSLFLAVGAVCTDMKDTQNLLWPVVLLAMSPLFLLVNVMQEPNSPVAVGLSFFPFATPTLMIARQSVPPGVPWWEGLLGVAVVLATTLACVWAAGRIFRVGLLIQGKPPRFIDLFRYVFRG